MEKFLKLLFVRNQSEREINFFLQISEYLRDLFVSVENLVDFVEIVWLLVIMYSSSCDN